MLATLLMNAGRKLDERKHSRVRTQLKFFSFQGTMRVLLLFGGFLLLTRAGFELNSLVGFSIAGISCLILSWLLTGSTSDSPQSTVHNR